LECTRLPVQNPFAAEIRPHNVAPSTSTRLLR
jgi:hypothetical protein